MATPGFSNPYLSQQADALQTQANQNLQYNLLPSVNSGAVAAGGYGGSRQGIAQGLAMGQTQQGISSALGNMYSTAYNNDQNLANQYKIANMQDLTSRYNAGLSLQGVKYGADRSLQGVKYSSDNSLKAASMNNATTMRGQDLQSQLGFAGLANQAKIAGGQLGLGYAGLQNQSNIAGMQNATTQRGQDISLNLGNQQNQLGYAGLANQSQIANMQNATNVRGQDLSNSLGLAGLNNQLNIAGLNNTTQRDIAQMQNSTTQRGQDQNYNLGLGGLANQRDLGMGNLALGFKNSNQSYDLGLRQNDLGFAGLDANIAQNNFQNQMAGANFGLGIYDRLQQANNLGITAGGNIQNTPLNYWNQFSNAANSIGQGYGTSTSSADGNPLMGAIGGAKLGQQIGNWWSSQNTPTYPGNNGFQTDYSANPFAAIGL